jgi:CTP synthase (UTP-ammonia lyase)
MTSVVSTLKIALVGDYSPDAKAHVAIPKALALAANSLGARVNESWYATTALSDNAADLAGYDGIWCVPANPYASMSGALNAIRCARESKIPFLGTCGGAQHALIEYCRNVLGLISADHAESNPEASFALIAPLPCALRETKARTMLRTDSKAQKIYGQSEITEEFNCGFGLNPAHNGLFATTPLTISGIGDDGIARVVELNEHPFFMATLFQPERSAFRNIAHPLIAAFLHAAKS